MDKFLSVFGYHKLKLLVTQLKAANSLAVSSQARKNILDDIQVQIDEQKKIRETQEDADKLFAIQLLLNVLKAKDIADFNEQKRLYDEYFRTSIRNARFANSANKPAPKTIKLAKQIIDESLDSLLRIVREKERQSPEYIAKREAERKQFRANTARELGGIISSSIRSQLPPNPPGVEDDRVARLRAQLNAEAQRTEEMRLANLRTRLNAAMGRPGTQGGKRKTTRTRKARKGKKGTRKGTGRKH
jgi:hypothetical protein